MNLLHNIVPDLPGRDATGSMPLSGSNPGLNVRVEGSGFSPSALRSEDQKGLGLQTPRPARLDSSFIPHA
jgi:hypothetical protein